MWLVSWLPHITVCIITLFSLPSIASPWNLAPKTSAHFATARYYSTDQFFDLHGNKQQKNGVFKKYEVQYYAEYGVTPAWTLGYNLFASHQRDSGSNTPLIELRGLTRSDIFARYQLYRDEEYAISVQPSFTLPPHYTTEKIADAILYDRPATELAFFLGKNITAFSRTHWLSGKMAYRHRFGALQDQWLLDAQAGISLTDHLTFIPEMNITRSAQTITNALQTIAGDNNYHLTKLTASLAYQFTPSLTVQTGLFQHVAGVNAGAGGGGMCSLWIKL